MNYENILIETQGNLGIITINRPDKLNALNHLTIQEIGRAARLLVANENIRGIIITGSGEKAFVAGADISEFAHFTNDQAEKLARAGNDVFTFIEQATKPFLAAVNGFSLGGGCELAMACHLRIASENAKFGQPEVNLGLIPGYAGTQRLPQLIGKTKAFELLLTGDMINAQQALALGLVNAVVPQNELLATAKNMMEKIASKAPLAVQEIIFSVNAFYHFETDGFEEETMAFARCFNTEDFKEGTQAFLEKRKPNFTGR